MRRRVLLVLAALLLAAAAAELALRRWYPIGVPGYRLDPVLLHEPIPGSRRIQVMPAEAGGGRVLVELGPQGYRGPPLEEPRTRPRLAVVGDSLVMAENVPYERSFPARLARRLGDRYEVVSIGASGYGPDQALLRLERDWPVLRPDLVLLVLCATNDHGDVVRNKLFHADPAGRPVRGSPILGQAVREYFARAARRGRDLALVRLARAWLHPVRVQTSEDPIELFLSIAEEEWEQREGGDSVVRHLLRDPYDADLAVAPGSRSARGKRALMEAVMRAWAESLAERRRSLAAVVVPSAVDLDPTFAVRVDPVRYPAYDPRALTDACVNAAAKAGIPVLDLYDLFAAHDPATLFVGGGDAHWNERGIELAAEAVAAWLGERGY